jgi:hypothetical protein
MRSCPILNPGKVLKSSKKGWRRCTNCNSIGHNSRTCPEIYPEKNRISKLRAGGYRLCTHCYSPGHNRRTCPELNPAAAKLRVQRKSSDKALRRCSICNSMEHNARTCSQR